LYTCTPKKKTYHKPSFVEVIIDLGLPLLTISSGEELSPWHYGEF